MEKKEQIRPDLINPYKKFPEINKPITVGPPGNPVTTFGNFREMMNEAFEKNADN